MYKLNSFLVCFTRLKKLRARRKVLNECAFMKLEIEIGKVGVCISAYTERFERRPFLREKRKMNDSFYNS